MWRTLWKTCAGAAVAMASGCATGPLLDNPNRFGTVPGASAPCENNPVWIALGQDEKAYGQVFEKILDVVMDTFEIRYANRYDGTILSFPRIAPGLEQPWKAGSPDFDERLLATLQTIRHRAEVRIAPAEGGGYFVDVRVFKELEDLPRPSRATAGSAAFRSDNTVERQFEVIDPTVFESNWIPIGRDTKLEQVMLQKMKACMPGG